MSDRQRSWDEEETNQLLNNENNNPNENGTANDSLSNGISHRFSNGTHQQSDDYDGARNALLSTLYFLCSKDPEEEPYMWDQVRQWFRDHTDTDIMDAAVLQGSYGITALHLVCRNDGPLDVISKFITLAPDSLEMIDSHGWLPLHYAAANGASDDLIKLLVDTFPPAVDVGDNQGRVPLHFALSSQAEDLSIVCATALASRVAASCKDENEMTAMHYTCAYGASVEVLRTIVDACKSDENPIDRTGKVPLHYTCGNPYCASSHDLASFLLDLYPDSVNIFDNNGNLPLRILATKVKASNDDIAEIEDSIRYQPAKILDAYLTAKPYATADFLTALQALPEWLKDRAVVTPFIQEVLNHKIATRFPTFIVLADFACYATIILFFVLAVPCSIQLRVLRAEPLAEGSSNSLQLESSYIKCTEPTDTHYYIYVIAFCSFYFLLRELAQILSLMSLGLFRTWLWDLTNWLDVLTIGSGLYFAGDMYTNVSDLRQFRSMASVAMLFYWVAMLSFLKSTFIEFSVFVGGLINVLNRLLAFLTALSILLAAFSIIFYIIYFDSLLCTCQGDECGPDHIRFDHFCNYRDSLVKVYTMLLGEVDEDNFLVNNHTEAFIETLGVISFSFFMFLVVILLANVLIAIVTDSYGVIKNERAAIVFWSNRLDFIAEMDAINYGPWKSKLDNLSLSDSIINESFGYNMWQQLTGELFMWEDIDLFSVEFFISLFLRGTIFLFIILLWLPLGLFTAGLLWPPQVRQWIFVQTHNKQSTGEARELERRSEEVQALKEEVSDLQDEIVHEMTADRMEVIALKAQFGDMKNELQNEMKEIKAIVSNLFDIQASAGTYT